MRMKDLFKDFWMKLKGLFQGGRFLCDTCRYDWGDACHRPQRPNATRCPDYKRR
jgi:hypothetical protein